METRIKVTDRYAAVKGFTEESYLLDCVRKGNRSDIEAVFSKEDVSQMEEMFGNDISFAKMVFSFIWSKIVYVVVENGLLDPFVSGEVYVKYYHNLQHAPSVHAILELNRRIFIDFADKVTLAGADIHLSPLVRKIHRYITAHIYEKLTVDHIAQKLHFSRSHLSHVYKRETGETITAGIKHRKIIEAKRLIQYSSLSLTGIGSRLGFCSQSHFIDVFQKQLARTVKLSVKLPSLPTVLPLARTSALL